MKSFVKLIPVIVMTVMVTGQPHYKLNKILSRKSGL
jgi:hypothetical protein